MSTFSWKASSKLATRERKRAKRQAAMAAEARAKQAKRSHQPKPPAQPDRYKAFYRSAEWKYLRYEALKAHGRRCGCCGATPEDGIRLNVDHVKPIRHYWDLRLQMSNLQVLCADCNIGKGARHQDDYREAANDQAAGPMDGISLARWHGL